MENLQINIKPDYVEYEYGNGEVGVELKNVVSISVDGLHSLKQWFVVVEKVTSCFMAFNTDIEDEVIKDILANGNQGKTFSEKLQEKIQENKNKNQNQ